MPSGPGPCSVVVDHWRALECRKTSQNANVLIHSKEQEVEQARQKASMGEQLLTVLKHKEGLRR